MIKMTKLKKMVTKLVF